MTARKYKKPECIVIWGYNIPSSCPDNVFGHWIIDLMKQGTKIICIDPRLSWFASRADKVAPAAPRHGRCAGDGLSERHPAGKAV